MIKLKRLYVFIKTYPLVVITLQALINAFLLRLIFIETNDAAKIIEILVLSYNILNLILNPLLILNTPRDSESD